MHVLPLTYSLLITSHLLLACCISPTTGSSSLTYYYETYQALLELVKAAEMLYYKSFTFTAPDTSPIVASSAGNGNACPSYTVWADAGVTATSLKGCTGMVVGLPP